MTWWKQTDPKQQGLDRRGLRLTASLSQNDARVLAVASNILCRYRVPFHYSLSQHRTNPTLQIVLVGRGRVEKFLELLLPYLVAKREQAAQMLEIIRYREKFKQRGPEGTYLMLDLLADPKLTAMINKLRWYKHNPMSPLRWSRIANQPMVLKDASETTRRTPVRDEDIVHAEP